MNPILKTWILIDAVALLHFCPITSAAAEVCVFQEDEGAPYYVLGSRVVPQSNVLIAGDCSSSFEVLNVEYLKGARARLAPNGNSQTSAAEGCHLDQSYQRVCTAEP